MYDYDDIEKMVKKFVEKQYRNAKEYPSLALTCRNIAVGALLFACNNLFPSFNYDLNDWWEDEMWAKFTDLIED